MSASPDSFRTRLRFGLVVLVLATLPILAVAGGLGLATSVALLGIGGVLVGLGKRGYGRDGQRAKLPPAFWALLALTLWAFVATLWSAYERNPLASNALKIVAGLLLYWVAAAALSHTYDRNPRAVRIAAWSAFLALVLITCIDLATSYGLSHLVDPLNPGENPDLRLRDAEMNVGHGITVGLLLLPAALVGAGQGLRPHGRAAALVGSLQLGAAFFLCSWMSGLWAGAIAVVALSLAMLLARARPQVSMAAVGVASALSILLAPAISILSGTLTAAQKAALPFSWEHRVESWRFIGERIAERPLFGHGFDASRTFDQTLNIRGYDMSLVSLHPHNAGLQIWLELGGVGAFLATLAVLALTLLGMGWAGQNRDRAMAVAGFIAVATVISGVSYGIWQEWWWASLFLCAGLIPVFVSDP